MREKVNLPFYFVTFYFVCVGSIYEYGYWSVFNINFFEYISAIDFLTSAIIPILNTLIFVLLGAFLRFLTDVHSQRTTPKTFSGTWWWQYGWMYLLALEALFPILIGPKYLA